jgi:hypothetical protein
MELHRADKTRSTVRRTVGLLVALCLAGLGLSSTTRAATTWHVTSSADDNTDGTLRKAIADAAAGDTIVIDAGANPALTQDRIVITKSVTIQGVDARATTISRGSLSGGDGGLLGVRCNRTTTDTTPCPTVTISNVTLTGGASDFAGALLINGTPRSAPVSNVSLKDVAVVGNTAASTVSGLVVGGIEVGADHTLSLNGVTVADNIAGIAGSSVGGLFVGRNASLTVVNSTIAGNKGHTVGGIYKGTGQAALTNVTIADNESTATFDGRIGNLFAEGSSVNVKNTIIAGGKTAAPGFTNCLITDTGAFSDLGHNVEDTSGTQCDLTDPSSLVGVDPKFVTSAVANNGGQTDTIALQSTSPAIGAVPASSCPATDQRGVTRPDYGQANCDVGAYEYQTPPDLTLAKTHIGAVTEGRKVSYTLSVTNVGGRSSSEVVGVTDSYPSGLSSPTGTGSGWNCASGSVGIPSFSCLRNDALPAGASYPPITITFDVVGAAGSVVENNAHVAGGGDASEANNLAKDAATIVSANHAPSAVGDTFATKQNAALTVAAPGVLANDSDADGDALKAMPLVVPTHGTLTLSPDGSFVYTPASGFVGTDAFTYAANDGKTDSAPATVSIDVTYRFAGFSAPVDNGLLNVTKAGSAVPVKFTLGGNQGLNIFAPGSPGVGTVACGGATDVIEQTETAGASSLTYDAATDQYKYTWKTNKAWAGTCRQLVLKLKDGTTQVANFQFT